MKIMLVTRSKRLLHYFSLGMQKKKKQAYWHFWHFSYKIKTISFFFGFLAMDQVTRLFIGKTEGAFVIRFSGSTPGTYTLSVMGAGGATIHHWRIGVENGNFVLNEKSFSNFEELVKYYKINPLTVTTNNQDDSQRKTILLTDPCDRFKSDIWLEVCGCLVFLIWFQSNRCTTLF